MVPSTVASVADSSASSSESVKALRMLSRRKNSTNQRSDSPGGGNWK